MYACFSSCTHHGIGTLIKRNTQTTTSSSHVLLFVGSGHGTLTKGTRLVACRSVQGSNKKLFFQHGVFSFSQGPPPMPQLDFGL